MNEKKFFGNKGFTLVELLVVVAIMALLLSLVFVLFSSARAKSRDAKREAEIKSLQTALGIYVTNSGVYPVYTGPITGTDAMSSALLTSGAIPDIPKDPINSGNYVYTYDSTDGRTYTITYYLETNTILGKSAGQQIVGP
jgi:type IV pilus assembly protein PilA